MTIEELRCEALRLAIAARTEADADSTIVSRAEAFFKFLHGQTANKG